jgi:hypothetical protein
MFLILYCPTLRHSPWGEELGCHSIGSRYDWLVCGRCQLVRRSSQRLSTLQQHMVESEVQEVDSGDQSGQRSYKNRHKLLYYIGVWPSSGLVWMSMVMIPQWSSSSAPAINETHEREASLRGGAAAAPCILPWTLTACAASWEASIAWESWNFRGSRSP